jgi:hypothetical protein
MPTDIYRATTTDLTTDAWTITDNGEPLVRRAHRYEVDQVADPFVVRGPGDTTYLFWEGADNRTTAFQMMVAPMQPALQQWDGTSWVPAQTSHPPRVSRYADAPWRIECSAVFQIPTARKVGTFQTGNDIANMIGGARHYNSSAALNDSLEYDVILAPGTWEFHYHYIATNGSGIVTIGLDDGAGSFVIPTIAVADLYNISAALINQRAVYTFTVYGTETIRRALRFKVTSKNASSSGFAMNTHGWVLQRTDT